ncbi:MAG: BACON domain-containing protein [Candidatus Cryptobacteroides sp.]
MKAKSLFFAALAIMMAACVPTEDPKDEFVPEFKVSGVKENTISVGASGKDVTVSVTSNLSWSIDCQSDWVSVDPASYTAKEDKTSETVKVKVSVLENDAEKTREATLTIAGEGVDPVKIAVKQAAKEHVYPTICVFDTESFAPVADYSVTADFLGGAVSFTVQANADWTAEFPEWAVLSPASFTYTDNDLATLTLTVASNLSETAREGEIRFKGEFESDLVIPVSQAAASKLAATYKSSSYRNVIMDVDAPVGTYWIVVTADDENYAKMGDMGLAKWIIGKVQTVADNNSAYYTASEIVSLLADGCGPVEDFNYDELPADSKLNLVVVPIISTDDVTVSLAGLPSAAFSFTTDPTPVASAEYEAILGTYVNHAYDYFESEEEDVYNDLVMVVEPYFINESVFISFTGGTYFPQGSKGTVDSFIGKFVDGKISIEVPQMSQLGYTWGFSFGDGAMVFDVLYFKSETVYIENLDFTPAESNLTVSASPASDVEGDFFAIQASIYVQGEDGLPTPSGKATGIAVILDPTFTRVEEEAPASVKAASAEKISFKKANLSLEKISKVYPAK